MFVNLSDIDGMPRRDEMGVDVRQQFKRMADKKRSEAAMAKVQSSEYVPTKSDGAVEYTPLETQKKPNGPSNSLIGPHTV